MPELVHLYPHGGRDCTRFLDVMERCAGYDKGKKGCFRRTANIDKIYSRLKTARKDHWEELLRRGVLLRLCEWLVAPQCAVEVLVRVVDLLDHASKMGLVQRGHIVEGLAEIQTKWNVNIYSHLNILASAPTTPRASALQCQHILSSWVAVRSEGPSSSSGPPPADGYPRSSDRREDGVEKVNGGKGNGEGGASIVKAVRQGKGDAIEDVKAKDGKEERIVKSQEDSLEGSKVKGGGDVIVDSSGDKGSRERRSSKDGASGSGKVKDAKDKSSREKEKEKEKEKRKSEHAAEDERTPKRGKRGDKESERVIEITPPGMLNYDERKERQKAMYDEIHKYVKEHTKPFYESGDMTKDQFKMIVERVCKPGLTSVHKSRSLTSIEGPLTADEFALVQTLLDEQMEQFEQELAREV
jgi:hypothetical protein